MKDHLNPDDISLYVAGTADRAAVEHVRGCIACRSEVERLTAVLAVFRDSVRNWSTRQESHVNMEPSRRRLPLRGLGWAAVSACLIAGLILPHELSKHSVAPHATTTISDAELLSQVNRELSEAVPLSMEPIALNQNRNQQ